MAKLISVITILVSVYLVYLSLVRTYNIAGINAEILDDPKKEELLSPLRAFVIAGIISAILNLVSFFLFPEILQILVAMIGFIVVGNCMYRILDEIDGYELTKKDSEILRDFLKQAEKDAKEKSK